MHAEVYVMKRVVICHWIVSTQKVFLSLIYKSETLKQQDIITSISVQQLRFVRSLQRGQQPVESRSPIQVLQALLSLVGLCLGMNAGNLMPRLFSETITPIRSIQKTEVQEPSSTRTKGEDATKVVTFRLTKPQMQVWS